jgi:hypothetical protein
MEISYIRKLVEYSLISSVLIVSSTILGFVFAARIATVLFSSATQIISTETQFPVNITKQPNNAVGGIQYNLYFNPAFINADNVSEGNSKGKNENYKQA